MGIITCRSALFHLPPASLPSIPITCTYCTALKPRGTSDLKTDYGNRGHSIAQTVRGLQRGTVYDFRAQIQIPGASSGVEYCFVDAYIGGNATTGLIVSQLLEPSGEGWTTVRGSYQRRGRRAEDVLTVTGSCTSPGSSYVWDVLVDEVVLEAVGGCV
ncbi:uncharacterized protein BO72DRAFT_451115 [Aspergillus fijiensis CBS 313.89]|uniref:CBM-cenC domain-containing protein n=1 Tax=Aspergillus fijiensis CBS 313.89 TaxID=1448319 RepID=A0A8G1RHI1_9EURO|nr:uncharacterized protein BO72DRAFT_451115 [Aspergillus fijiensis CBS 313.89]RAK74002.1 hypothetical protein BO72DRAFT_451115 [Aspergillus fijiensis CBS 313.89]